MSFPNAVTISALKGEGISQLLERVNANLYDTFIPVIVRLPYQDGGLIAAFHDQGQVERVEQTHAGVIIHGRLPGRMVARYQPFVYKPAPGAVE